RKAPSVSCGSADGAWHQQDVDIHCTASDGGSGLADAGDSSFNLSTSVASDTENPDASTVSRDVCDNVSHCTAAGPVSGNQVDKKAPVIHCDAAPSGWQGGNVDIHCMASDGGSGLALAGDASFTLSTVVAADTEE